MRSGNLLQEQLHSLLNQGNNEPDKNTNKIETSVLKIINNTIIFDNTVYQIRNICVVELADLTKTLAINQTIPNWYWFLLTLGFVLLFFYGLGIFLLLYVACLFWQHHNLEKSKIIEKYGLRICMNSGEGVTLLSNNRDFVIQIIVTLYQIMNTDTPQAVAFHFKTLQVEDKSINIKQAYGSAVISGQVRGDVVNNV